MGQEGGDLRQAALEALQAMELGMGTEPGAAGAADAAGPGPGAGVPLGLSLAPGPQRPQQWGHRLSSETGSEPGTPQLVLGGGGVAGVPHLPPWSAGQQHVTISPAATARRPSSPTGHRPGSPTSRRPGSPTNCRPGSPTNRRPGSPTGHCPGSPTNRRPGSPTGRAGVMEGGGAAGVGGHKAAARSFKVSFSKVDRQARGGQGASDSEESEDDETPRDAAGADGRSSKVAAPAAAAAAAAAVATGATQAPIGPRPNSARGPAGGTAYPGTADRGGGDGCGGGGGYLSARLSSRPTSSPNAHHPQPSLASLPTSEASNTCPPSPTAAYVPYTTSASGAVPYGSARSSTAAAGGGGGVTARGAGVASGPTLSSAAGLDRAWTQLEALMIQLHDSHVARGDLVGAMEHKAGEGTASGTAGGGGGAAGGAGSRGGTAGGGQGAGGGKGSTASSLAVLGGGVEGSGPGGSARGSKSAVDRLVTLMNATLELGAGGEDGEGGGQGGAGGEAGRRGSVDPAAAAGALRAAVVGALQPKHTEQVGSYPQCLFSEWQCRALRATLTGWFPRDGHQPTGDKLHPGQWGALRHGCPQGQHVLGRPLARRP